MEKTPFDKVRTFIQAECPTKKPLSRDTKIGSDLGYDGDDMKELLLKFLEHFKIEKGTLDVEIYAQREGVFMTETIKAVLNLIKGRRPEDPHEITLGDLERALIAGKWT